MDLDIRAALDAAPPTPGQNRQCKLAKAIAAVPEEAEARQELVDALVDAKEFPAHRLAAVFASLSRQVEDPVVAELLHVSEWMVKEHRGRRCVCVRG